MRSTASLLDQRKRIDERALEREEEDYFNEDRFVVIVECIMVDLKL